MDPSQRRLRWLVCRGSRQVGPGSRVAVVLGVVSSGRLAGRLRSRQGRRQGQAGRRRTAAARGGGQRRRAEDGADLQRVRRPDRRQGDGGDPCPRAGLPRSAALHRGHDRQEEPAAVHAGQARVRGQAAAGQGPARDRAGPARQGRNRRAAPEAAGRAQGRAAAGLRQRRGQPAGRQGERAGRPRRRRRGAAGPELHDDPLADHRPDRQAPGGARQPRRQGRRHLARHRVEHRSDPRQRHHQRSRVPALLRPGQGAGQEFDAAGADPGRRQRPSVQGQAGHRRPGGGPEDRHADLLGRVSERRRPAAPRAVRSRARGRRDGQGRDPDSEAGGAGDPGHADRARGRRRQHGRAAHDPAGRKRRRPADRARRSQARRTGDRRRHPEGPARLQGQSDGRRRWQPRPLPRNPPRKPRGSSPWPISSSAGRSSRSSSRS